MNSRERRTEERRNEMRRGESRRVGARRNADSNDEFLLPDVDDAFPEVPDFPKAQPNPNVTMALVALLGILCLGLGILIGKYAL